MEVVKANEIILKLGKVLRTILIKGQDMVIFIPEYDLEGRLVSQEFLEEQEKQVFKLACFMLDRGFPGRIRLIKGICEEGYCKSYNLEGEEINSYQQVIFLHQLTKEQELEVLTSFSYEATGELPIPLYLFEKKAVSTVIH